MQRINLLYVITKLELGGAQKQLLSLINKLDKTKFKPFLLTAKAGLLLPEAISITGLTVKKSKWLIRPIDPFKDILALIEIHRFIRKNNIEVVHTHSSKAGILGRLAARLAKIKIILHSVHGWSFHDYQPSLIRLFFIWLERLGAKFTDKLIVVSDYDRQKGLDNRIGRDDQYSLIRYGIDPTEFSREDQTIKKELGIGNNDLAVGMIACFKPQKLPQDFIKLASLINKLLPNVKFFLIGDGILRKEIQRLVRKFNLQKYCILTGWRRDISRILSAIDVFALTSLWEGLPITALEAMASGKPVVATDTGGIREVIREGETGFLVSPRDMDKMSERIVMLLKDRILRIEIGQKARDSLGFNFTLSHMVRESENIYGDLLKKKEVLYGN